MELFTAKSCAYKIYFSTIEGTWQIKCGFQ